MKTNSHRWFDWFSAALLIAAFITVAVRLRITEWTSNLEVVEVLGLIACVLGLLLGASRFSELACFLFALNYTIFFVPWQWGLLIGKNINWDERLLSVIGRLSYSVNEVASNRPIQDPLLFLATMSLFFWVLALVAGYQLARNGRPWAAVSLLGLVLAIIDFYTPYQGYRDRYSGVFVFLILLMVARIYLLRSRREWSEKGMAVDPEIGYDLGRTVAFSGLALVLLAWNVPTLVDALTPGTEIQKELAKSWESVRNRFQNAVAGLQNPVSITSEFYGSELALGTGGSQGDDIVFTVSVAGGRPLGVRFYWRARSYDQYDGSQWLTSLDKTRSVPANEWPYQYMQYDGRKEVTLSFTPNLNLMRNIYTAGEALQVTRPTDVLAVTNPDKTSDVIAVIANPQIHGGETYTVRSWTDAPTIAQLTQSDATNYPSSIKQLYLQLPTTISPRIVALAKQITEGLTNPYDQAMAITDWLRKNIKYSLTVPPVPENRDILEWFLFDLKEGYCNYYASAEVIMLRSLGIPARLAVGYAEGETTQSEITFTVRRRDSHAWPEVYFNKVGWVEFEPTSAQPQTILPSGSDTTTTQSLPGRLNNPGLSDEEPTQVPAGDYGRIDLGNQQNTVGQTLIIVIPVSLGLLIALFFYLRRTRHLVFFTVPLPVLVTSKLEKRGVNPPRWLKNWAVHMELSPMERLFSRMDWMLLLLGRKAERSQTPAERVADLISAAPNAREPAQAFLEEYQRDEYSPTRGDIKVAANAHRRLWREVTVGAVRRIISAFSS